MPPVAVIDMGTNSTRLLVAEVEDGTVHELVRRSNVTRLGDKVDSTGRLDEAAIERVFKVLSEYGEEIDRHGVERVVAVATSAVRDADNGDEFRAALAERHGIDAQVIPGDEEARLSFLGATAGRDEDVETLVVDIGGGSTEYVVGSPGATPRFHVSTRMGSVRHTERHLKDDPPTPGQVEALRRDAGRVIEEDVPAEIRNDVRQGIAVAGTATSLAAIDQELESYDSARVHGHVLSVDACDRMLHRLASLPLDERREVPGLHPDRAPTIVAGAAILAESIEAFQLGSVEVSEADILHGAALAAAAEVGGLEQGGAG